MRKREKRRDISAHITAEAVNPQVYNRLFLDFLVSNTDYLTYSSGIEFNIPHVSIWDHRGGVGDHVSISIPRKRFKKIAVFPLWDATYNTYRNWQTSPRLTQEIIDRFSAPEFDGYEKLICSPHTMQGVNFRAFEFSTDFSQNIEHLLTCSNYVGGDSGLSHFAGSLVDGPLLHYYMNGERGVFHTAPLNYLIRGELLLYS